jgi:type IX secretion system PorP/SprF family membrane protein
MSVGFINFDLSGSWSPPETPASGDPYIPQEAVRKIVLDLNFGIFYQIKDKFYFGISTTHINQPEIKYPGVTASFLRRHYYATTGYNLRLLNSPIELKPSVFAEFDGTKLQLSGNITGLYNKKFWLGVSYRNQDAIFPMAGVVLVNGLKVGYAYELSLSKMITVSKGTHEVFLEYSFDIWKANKNYKYKSILYL